jgi:hypothetical protein
VNNLFDAIDSSLRVLGRIGTSSNPAAADLFSESASRLVEGNTETLGIAVERSDGFEIVAAVGDGPRAGDVLDGARGTLAARALDAGKLVSDLVVDDAGTRLIIARPTGGTRTVAYEEISVDADWPVPSTPDSPFWQLRMALYAGHEIDPARLVSTTETELPLAGETGRERLTVGADTWLLVVSAREPLGGSFA